MEATAWDPEGATWVLDTDGRLSDTSVAAGLDLRSYYKALVAARCLDVRLARANLPMFASAAGEEAPLVATAFVARDEDWIYPGLRDGAIALVRGMSFDEIAHAVVHQPTLGFASASLRIGTGTAALGMHLAIAAGQAHGQKLAGTKAITFALLGEGTTTTAGFHETLVTAATCDLPLVLVCRSQLWPAGAPAEAGVVGDSVVDRARAYGVWERRVDGADPIAVWAAIAVAAARARDGKGPSLVEVAVTQLMHDPPAHRDPVERLRRHLDANGQWSATFQDVVEAEVRTKLDRALSTARGGA